MTNYLIIAAVAVAMLSAPVSAQQPAPAESQSGLGGYWLQADQTRSQAQQRADTMFQMLDANRDGQVTRQEAEQAAAQMGGKGGGRMAGRLIDRLFSQSDTVTHAQFSAQAMARFDRQDLNHDGTVTAAERQQVRAARQQPGQ